MSIDDYSRPVTGRHEGGDDEPGRADGGTVPLVIERPRAPGDEGGATSVPPRLTDAIGVFLGAHALSIMWAGLLVTVAYGGFEAVPDRLPIGLWAASSLGLWTGYVGGTALVARIRGSSPTSAYGARFARIDPVVGVAIGVALNLAVIPAIYWPILRLVDGDPSARARELIGWLDSPLDWAVLVIVVVVVGPAVEEYYFRGLLLRSLTAVLGTVGAVVVSSSVFALVHNQLLGLPGFFVVGAVAAILAVRSGRLGPAWAMHAAFNATTVIVLALESRS